MASSEFDNVFVCYTAPNYLKALYLAHLAHERGERSRILGLFLRGRAHPALADTSAIDWAEVEILEHVQRHVPILASDLRDWPRLARKLATKLVLKARRELFHGAERRRVLAEVARARRVYLFLERTYFSNLILRRRACTLVEEGCATYRPYRLRSPFALAARERFPGEHERVTEILLQRPEHAHPRIRDKVRPFELRYRELPREVRERILRSFPLELPANGLPRALIVGQAWSVSPVPLEQALELYRHMAALLASRGYAVHLKPHPSESPEDYAGLGVRVLDPRVPLDAFELRDGPPPFDFAVSVLSSSLNDAPHLAAKRECFLEGEIVVEDLRPADLERAREQCDARLLAALACS